MRLDRQAAFKSSTLWCVRAGKGLNACSHSYLHLNITHYAVCNISLSGTFPASLISNCMKNTVQYIFSYTSCIRLVRNSQNVTVGLLTPWGKIFFEKLTSLKLVNTFPTFYGTRRFITTFTSAHQLSLSEPARSSPYPHIPLPESILILSSHLCLCLPSGLSLRYPHQNLEYAFPLPYTSYMPHPLHSSRFYHPKNIVSAVQIIKFLVM